MEVKGQVSEGSVRWKQGWVLSAYGKKNMKWKVEKPKNSRESNYVF